MKVKMHTPLEEIQVPIIPMIDVIFCILTFFLLAALQFTRQQAINVDLPKATTGTTSASSSPDRLYVEIQANGQVNIQNHLVRRDSLEPEFREYIQTHPSGILVLNASRTAVYNDIIQMLDLMRKVGGNRVALGIVPDLSPSNTAITPNTVPIPENSPQNSPQGDVIPPQVPLAPGDGIDQGISPIIPDNNAPQVPVAVPPKNKK